MGNNGGTNANGHIVADFDHLGMKLININILADPDILPYPDTTQPVQARTNSGATRTQIS